MRLPAAAKSRQLISGAFVNKAICAFIAALFFAAPVCAQSITPSVLSMQDIETYRGIFAAQDSGEMGRADTMIASLENRVLLGYVLHQRYMGRYYVTQYQELSTWLSEYSDLSDAERIYNLALRKKTGGARNPVSPSRVPWRGERFDHEATEIEPMDSARGERILRQLRDIAGNDDPSGVERAAGELSAASDLPQGDVDLLRAYAASSYLAEGRDAEAVRVAEAELARPSSVSDRLHWVAGLAAYRLGDFAVAANHFEAMSADAMGHEDARNCATGAFWAARAYMRMGDPSKVVTLYERAASKPFTFYGMLASRVLGREAGFAFEEPRLDAGTYGLLMDNPAAERAVALWQIGRQDAVEIELARAFGEITSSLDPAFAALAHTLGAPGLELRAAETSAARGIFLTSLYPIPPYEPEGGYRLDQAMVLAVARQESRFNPIAASRSGARGLMQIMPGTAAYITRDPSLARGNNDRLDDPAYSMRLGEDYLQDLLHRQNGNLLGLAAAYNAGLGNLSRWLGEQEGNDDPILFIESLPVPETRDYVKRVMINIWMYQLRFGEPPLGMDDAAAGKWPLYPMLDEVAVAQ
jgi:soluble lytic murein transglycosylase